LATLLPVTEALDVSAGLVAESLAYSMLLGSGEFAGWRARTPVRSVPEVSDPVLLERDGDRLLVTLNRPERRNAFGRAVRDGLLSALTVAELDASVFEVDLRGAGPAYCSGGDLDEFGSTGDPAVAHAVRLQASAGAAVHRLRDRIRPHLHGACVGAGIEVPAFAGHVVAQRDAWFQLPELRMGLVPGAGGTVSIPRRIGRWRTAWLGLSGARLDAVTALSWGLVDELVD
jgi:enoyl-CoA hydratase/carnithine racemase